MLGSGLMLKLLAKPVAQVMQRQPAFQPFNFQELQVTFSRSEALRSERLAGLACLEHPEERHRSHCRAFAPQGGAV